jgi:YidC/Oxa1 family membrane protein insertase
MNRDSIIGFILIAAILIGYFIWMQPSEEELAERKRKADSLQVIKRQQDSIALVRAMEEQQRREQEKEKEQNTISAVEDSANLETLSSLYGDFAASAVGEEEVVYIETDLFNVGISTLGGKIVSVELKKYSTWDSLPLILIKNNDNPFGFNFFAGTRSIHTKDLFFEPVTGYDMPGTSDPLGITGQERLAIAMRAHVSSADGSKDNNRYIEYVYEFTGDKYMLDFTVNFVGMRGIIDARPGYIDMEWEADLRQQEKSVDRFNGSTVYYKISDDKVDYLSESSDDEERLKDRVKWVSFKQHFFSSTLITDRFFEDPILRTETMENTDIDRYLKTTYAKLGVPYEESDQYSVDLSFYFGPNKYNVLRKYHLDLEKQIPLGWSFFLIQWINRYAVLPVFNFLGSFGWNYGIVILVLTILLKIVLFPITYKTYMSSARMRVLKPEIDELNQKFPKKEDSMKKQQAMMSLYKRAGVNPMSGCFPVLLQLPILIAMFRFFPASIELRQQSFLWATDLSTYDSILSLPFTIPFYGDHVSLFTLLMTISTLIYTYLNNQMMTTGTQQMPGMKTMMYIMPIMFLGIFNSYASGLSYYYFLVNIITFLQMFIFRKVVNEDKIYQKIQENKKKPVKKSSFQKRLEDAAKKRGYNPNQLRKK